MLNIKNILVLVVALSLGACSSFKFSDKKPGKTADPVVANASSSEIILPVPTEEPVMEEQKIEVIEVSAPQPVVFNPVVEPAPVPAQIRSIPVVSDSFVSHKINTFKNELSQLQGSVLNRAAELRDIKAKMAQDSKNYYEVVAEISSRLQMGTTQGNPILNAKWRDATIMLDVVSQDVTAMNNLASQITADAGMTTYLLDSVRASYNISGAVDEDHTELKVLEDETIQVAVQNERLLGDVNTDIARQQQYIVNEKKNLSNLAIAIRDGQLYNQNTGSPMPNSMRYRKSITESVAPQTARAVVSNNRKALVEIRFVRDNIEFEQPLYMAMQRAVEQKQDIVFEIIGVASNSNTAKKHVDKVAKSMMNMGVPATRIRTSTNISNQKNTPEVKIFVK